MWANAPSTMNKISHKGIVERIDDGCVVVRIKQTSACAACKVASHCSAAESKEKLITVKSKQQAAKRKVGEEVTVAMSAENGRRAVIVAFILPFIIMVAVLVACISMKCSEPLAALASIASIAVYYLLVFFFNKKLERKFAFIIEN